MSGGIAQYFNGVDYLLALPISLLTLFALGVLIMDLMMPSQWKRMNGFVALVGIVFAALGTRKIQIWYLTQHIDRIPAGFMGTLLVNRFSIYFFYLFLAGTAISIRVPALRPWSRSGDSTTA